MRLLTSLDLDTIRFSRTQGLVPLIAQHAHTGEVLMLGWADRPALERTLDTGDVWFRSRSRKRLWRKGETSGNVLRLVALHADCDADAVLALVEPAGPACHTGQRSCFGAPPILPALDDLLAQRATQWPEGSYTTRLLRDPNLRLKKLGEEAVELALACARGDAESAAEEAGDLLYHVLVACRAAGAGLPEVLEVLAARAALDEKPVHGQQQDRPGDRDQEGA